MGLAWQQGPLGANPAGRFLLPQSPPEHLHYAEPVGRRMRVELDGVIVAQSDRAVLLHETERYPVAYFPLDDVNHAVLHASPTRTTHPQLGDTAWWTLDIEGRQHRDVAWSYPAPPVYADVIAGLIAFVWDAMDAFYEEDEPIFGHAADPYHRVDIRASSRHLTAHAGGQLIADTRAALVVFETGFAPRWYVSHADVDPTVLNDDPQRTFCPYKGVARYLDIAAAGTTYPAAAWTYPTPLDESRRLAGYVSFDLDQIQVRLDDEPLSTADHQQVTPTGTDRDLTVPTR